MKFIDFFKGESVSEVAKDFPAVDAIIKEVSKDSFPNDLMSTVMRKKEFSIYHEQTSTSFYFLDSLHTSTSGHRCFLAFGDREVNFYIIVHYSPIAIYIPELDIFISLYKIYEATPDRFINDLNSLLDEIDFPRNIDRGAKKKLGLLVRSLRPFHYFFEVEYGLWNFVESCNFDKDELTYFINTEESFFPFWEMNGFKGQVLEYKVPTEFNNKQYEDFTVLLPFLPVSYPGGGSLISINKELEAPDQLIIEKSLELCENDPQINSIVKELKDCSVVLWFGICSEKRKWHELTESIIKICETLNERGENVGLVLDGMTGRISSKVEYKKQLTLHDNKVAEKIEASLPKRVKCISLINATVWTKLGIANEVDFFMSHHMTDSIFISRFSGVPGITHQSKIGTIAKSPQYRHPNIFQAPAEWITDDESNGRSPDTSYSIDSTKMVEFFIDKLSIVLTQKRTES